MNISEVIQKVIDCGYTIRIEKLTHKTAIVLMNKQHQTFGEILDDGFSDEDFRNAIQTVMNRIE